jgi:cell division protease FtsH
MRFTSTGSRNMQRNIRFHVGYWFAAAVAILLLQIAFSGSGKTKAVPYSEFRQLLEQNRIADVEVRPDTLLGRLRDAAKDEPARVLTQRVDAAASELLAHAGVSYHAAPQHDFLNNLLSWIAPTLVFAMLWIFLLPRIAERQGMSGGLMAIGKSKAKVFVETDIPVSFADVAGVDEAKAELQEVVAFLKAPGRYGRLGARLPKGILLVGPPGTGKTLLARAVAGEAGVPFFSINGSEFVEMFVGVGAARVRDLFDQARQRAPAIIFIDELDALGRARGAYGIGGHDEKEQTLNQLLSELDGFDSRGGLVLLAATNRPEILDPALLRAGRFDRQVLVDRPDKIGRVQILKVHVRKLQCEAGVDLEQIAALTPGFSGADLANLANEAALLATRRGGAAVSQDDFSQAIERIVAGLEKRNRLLNPNERRIVAHHELGHAFVSLALEQGERVQKVSIIPRGIGALGYTIRRPIEDRYLMSRDELQNKMAVLLGGRAAEELAFMDVSTGAADDLAKATDIARAMAMRYGMVAEIGPAVYEEEASCLAEFAPFNPPASHRISDEMQQRIDFAVAAMLEDAQRRAVQLLSLRWPALQAAAQRLLEKETLGEQELLELFRATPPLAAPVAAVPVIPG